MNRRTLRDWVRRKSKSPIWVPISVLLAVASLAGSFYLGGYWSKPSGPNRLIITAETTKALVEFPAAETARTRILIQGKEERHIRLFIYRIQYKGNRPVLATDFERPLRGTVPSDRKLLVVQRASNLEGPTIFENRRAIRDPAPPNAFEARILDGQRFEIVPALMNPNEWFGIEIYTSANEVTPQPSPTSSLNSTEEYKVLSSEIAWSCHVAGVKCPATLDLDLDFTGFIEPWYLNVHLAHTGWAVYGLVFFTTLNLILLVILAKESPLIQTHGLVQLLLFAIAIPMSLCTGEILTHWLISDLIPLEQAWGVQSVFWVDVLVIVALTALVIARKVKNPGKRHQRQSGPKTSP